VEVPRADRRPPSRALLVVAAASAALAALAILTVDRPIARAIGGYEASELWARGVDVLELAIGWPIHPLFASFAVTALTLAAMAVPRWRPLAPAAMFLAATHVFSRYATGQIKDLTARLRPAEWLKAGGGDDTFFSGGNAFPSGHVALFASLTIPIALRWPRTRPVLAVIAFAGAARIAVNAHFLSDTLAAVALVSLIAWCVGHAVRPFPAPGR
jgi:membrane-associated phospholipid phosphatase